MEFIEQGQKGESGNVNFLITLFLVLIVFSNDFFIHLLLEEDLNSFFRDLYRQKNSNLVLIQIFFPYVLMVILMYVSLRFLHRRRLRSIVNSKGGIRINRIIIGFLSIFLPGLIMTFLDYNYNEETAIICSFELVPFLKLLCIGVFIIPFMSIFNQMFFRGYFFQWMALLFKRKYIAILVSCFVSVFPSLLLNDVHFSWTIFIYIFISTIFYYIYTVMDDGIELATGLHNGNNAIVLLLVNKENGLIRTDAVFTDTSPMESFLELNSLIYQILPILILNLIFIWIYAKVFRWTGWKKRIFGSIKIDTNNESTTQFV